MLLPSVLSALLACSVLAPLPATATQERLDPAPADEAGGTAAGGETAEGSDNTIPGEILVKFEEGVSREQIDRINRRLGATVVNTMMEGRLLLVTIPYKNATAQLVDAYSGTEGVEYAEPNREVSLFPPPEEEEAGAPPAEGRSQGGGLPPPNEDGSAPLIPLPGPH